MHIASSNEWVKKWKFESFTLNISAKSLSNWAVASESTWGANSKTVLSFPNLPRIQFRQQKHVTIWATGTVFVY